MRFILLHKYGILQTKTERVDVKECVDTGRLLEALATRVGQQTRDLIVRVRRGRMCYRVVAGWSLETYSLQEGSEIELEVLETPFEQSSSSRYLSALFGQATVGGDSTLDAIGEQEEQSGFTVRGYLDRECERLLQLVKRKDCEGVRKLLLEVPEEAEQVDFVELQNKKTDLINELGQEGWGALHYAIFYSAHTVFDALLSLGAEVNKCTSDGWLPLQLAIDSPDNYFFQQLLLQPTLNINLVTARGSPLHTAARTSKPCLKQLLQRDADCRLKDNQSRTPIDCAADDQTLSLLRAYDQKKDNYSLRNQQVSEGCPTAIKGYLLKSVRPFMELKKRFLRIDPFLGTIVRYQKEDEHPRKPKESLRLKNITQVKIVQTQQFKWWMKPSFTHFFLLCEGKQLFFACNHLTTAEQWRKHILAAIGFAEQLALNPALISHVKRSEVNIEDTQTGKPLLRPRAELFDLTTPSLPVKGSQQDSQKQSVGETNRKSQSLRESLNKEDREDTGRGLTQNLEGRNINEGKSKTMEEGQKEVAQQLRRITTERISFADFEVLRTLGEGSFGKVFLARCIRDGGMYALKALKKKNLILQRQLKYAVIEASILKEASHPFIINLHFAFQTPHYLYLALDYCPGHDLSWHLARQVVFAEDEARYYVGQLCLAIEYLHSKGVIYRDLKPENVLLDAKGDVKLADFGLSKQSGNQTKRSFCGTPAYLSPQMLANHIAGKESDFYGIGLVLYECLVGEPPFFSNDINSIYKNISEGKLKFPNRMSESAKNLIASLLERDPSKRLGHQGWQSLKDHSFFASLNWDELLQRKLTPPRRPTLDAQEQEEDEEIHLTTQGPHFKDFDYDDSTRKLNRLANFTFIRS